MKNKIQTDAVKIEGDSAVLELHYKDSVTGSDSNTFIQQFFIDADADIAWGRLNREQAMREVVISARNWIEARRLEGSEIGGWDDAGNSY
jgi:hypothetical protein